jgi:hypothetical protein
MKTGCKKGFAKHRGAERHLSDTRFEVEYSSLSNLRRALSASTHPVSGGRMIDASSQFGFQWLRQAVGSGSWFANKVSQGGPIRVQPNPSLKRSANGGPPAPGRWYRVHFHQPGAGGPPSSPA